MPNPSVPEIIKVRMPSRLELLSVLDRVTDSVCERLQFDDDVRSQVTMSVIEAGTNAIQHGHHRDPSKAVDVEFRMHPDALEITVHDNGQGFNPQAINGDITSPEHLLDARGRGLFIMRCCMDRVEFEFGVGGTLCRLIKNRPGKAENA
jgi:serine/threonine-protein kinase RsbW